jgi:hypothetical protein
VATASTMDRLLMKPPWVHVADHMTRYLVHATVNTRFQSAQGLAQDRTRGFT